MKFFSYLSKILIHIYAIALLLVLTTNQANYFNASFMVAKAQAVAIITALQRLSGT